jgi:hypothetical protein
MKNGRFYFSKETLEDCIWGSSPYMSFVFIPSKWWSVRAWRLALSLRKNFYLTGIIKKDGE